MIKRLFISTLFFTLGSYQMSWGQSFEGYIMESLPVWMDLVIPANGETFSGTYFYKTNGNSIPLSGTIRDNQLVIYEKNDKGINTGVFTCFYNGDSITGTWKKLNSTKLLPVKLFKTEPSFKLFAKIPSAEKLILLKGNTLNDELKEMTNEGSKRPKLEYLFAEKSILCISFEWEYLGPYLSTGTIYHTFDLTKNKEISLLNEIDPDKLSALKDKIKSHLREKLIEHKKKYSEKEWIEAFGDKESFENSFKVAVIEDQVLENYYLKHGRMNIVLADYFGFPHAIQVMDLSTVLTLSFSEMSLYLKSNSIFGNLK